MNSALALPPLTCQKAEFSLPAHIHYLNCATRSPVSHTVAQAGHNAIDKQRNPFGLYPDAFFTGAERVRTLFSELVNTNDPERIAIIPSVAYGMGVVARNLFRKPGVGRGQKIVLVGGEFPSDVYAWDRVCAELGLTVAVVNMPTPGVESPDEFPVGPAWNEQLLNAIDANTVLVVVPPTHWVYGIRFDLEAVGQRARDVGAWLAVDGTQSVGALPFDLASVRPDALICAGYKWLMGPYSLGLAYFGPAFDDGVPLEESWANRIDSNLFHRLTEYQPQYRPKAFRYNMGEASNFTQMPMLEAALTQLLTWQPARIQDYTKTLMAHAWSELEKLGCRVEPETGARGRSHHLVGLWLPERADSMAIAQALQQENVAVSARARLLRVAPNVYNDAADADALVRVLQQVL